MCAWEKTVDVLVISVLYLVSEHWVPWVGGDFLIPLSPSSVMMVRGLALVRHGDMVAYQGAMRFSMEGGTGCHDPYGL